MVDHGKNIALKREGTNQQHRFLKALAPDSVRLNDFSLEQWMSFAYDFAKQINFFDKNNSQTPSGDWQDFFKSKNEIQEFLNQVETGGNIPPHLALFVTFIQLLEFPKIQLNHLTQRHLDYYYRNILQIEKLPAVPDKVYLLFELAKKATEEYLPIGTAFDGGKDKSGRQLIYKTAENFVVNQAEIAQLKIIYNHAGKITSAEIANSWDGLGGGFPNNEIKWWPFGHPNLQDTNSGFAFASSILNMKEGKRKITIEIVLDDDSNLSKSYTDLFQIWFTGEKEWLGPFNPQSINVNNNTLTIRCYIPEDEKAIAVYDQQIHGGGYAARAPVCKIMLKNSSQFYESIQNKTIKTLKITANVQEIENLEIENDQGKLNASKPFYPFGTQPTKGADFFIAYPELIGKKLSNIRVKWLWKNLPDSFAELYDAYRKKTTRGESKVYETIVTSNNHFKVKVAVRDKGAWNSNYQITAKNNLTQRETKLLKNELPFQSDFSLQLNQEIAKDGLIRISLNQSFYHELYPKILMKEMTKTDGIKNIPNPPYIPLAQGIIMDYTAVSERKFDENTIRDIQFFHEHPFGQSEVAVSKNQNNDENNITLFPSYNTGELYIGLKNANPLQTISLLVQLLEGSENPESESKAIKWYVLIWNEWRLLDSNEIIKDETDNFLKTGLIQFIVPEDANQDNTLLPPGLIWIKARLSGTYDSVCQCVSIDTQAVLIQFANEANEDSHLKDGLPAQTISKMIQKRPAIKSVIQPYASFNGRPQESDEDYYLRVSERLRHKNRAITLWDYEHLVLQQFPKIYKVRCLNHTSDKSFLAPGHVCLIVVPDISTHHVYDIYQPCLSLASLHEIEIFLEKIKSPMVKIWVENPNYEEVKVKLNVKFRKGFDESYYKRKLQEDITHFISPWMHKSEFELKFAKTIHKSELIYFIENLEYVDYLTDVKLYKKVEERNFEEYAIATPENPKGVLCSVRNDMHLIELINK